MLFVISAILLLGEWAARRTAPFELRDGQINLLLPSPEQGITEQFERDGVPMWRRAHPGYGSRTILALYEFCYKILQGESPEAICRTIP